MNTRPKVSKYIIPILIIALLQVVFEFFMENGTSDFYLIINSHFPFTFRTILILIIYSLIGMLLYRGIVSFYEQEIDDRDNKLKSKALQIWNKYNDLHKYKTNEAICKAIKNYLNKDNDVLAVQIYEYSIKYIEKRVEVKIQYNYGDVYEGIDINSIIQAYYKIDINTFDKFNKALDNSNNGGNNIGILKVAIEYINKLNSKPLIELNEEDSLIHDLILLSIQQITEKVEVSSILSKDHEEKLVNMKRNGIIRAILNKDYYYFRNQGDNINKQNRIYVSRTILLNQMPHVILMSINTHFLDLYGNDELIKALTDKGEEFLKLLQNDVDIDYNEINEGSASI